MKLLFLCKRRPQGRDLRTSPYGRFYYLPLLLARKGHEVTIFLCSYKREPDQYDFHDEDGIRWNSVSLANLNPFRYYTKARQLAGETRPDWIIGFSDTYYGIMAYKLAQSFGCKSMIDAYDNYESYIPWFKPLHFLWREVIEKADLVTAAGPQLADFMGHDRLERPAIVLPMAADPIGFQPLDKIKCRHELALPDDKKLIGYCGSIHSSRGIETLFDAFNILSNKYPDIELILTGRKSQKIRLPPDVSWLGYLPDDQMPYLLNSMDVLTVINKSSSFGNFSYPVKLYEAMCCKVPVIATSTPATRWILNDFQALLAEPGNSVDLSNKVANAIQYGRINYGYKQGWENEADFLEKTLETISDNSL